MSDDLPNGQRPELPTIEQPSSLPTEEQEIQAVNSREELLLRAKGITRRIQERVWKVMGGEEIQGPHDLPPEVEVGPEPIERQVSHNSALRAHC